MSRNELVKLVHSGKAKADIEPKVDPEPEEAPVPDTSYKEAAEQLSVLAAQLIKALEIATQKPTPPAPSSYEFEMKRDRNGFLTSVVAKPTEK